MLLRPVTASLLLALLLPVAVDAQQTTRERSSSPRAAERPDERLDSAEAQLFRELLKAIESYSLTPHDESELWEKAIEGLMKELGDPYATVLSPDEVREFEEQSTGNYAGIGVQITELNEAVTITAVFRNTPADQAGLQVGDRIVAVDGDPADAWSVGDASDRIRGDPGTTVEVTIRREGISQPIPHTIERAQVHVPAVTAERIFGDVGYVLLDRVARNSAAEVDSVLRGMDGARGLILDLRRNPGGYLDESLNLADLFLERGSVLVKTRARSPRSGSDVREDSAHARRSPRVPDMPIVVLVDRFSASAAEIVAGALQDHDRAVVVGERTFGKGSVQSVVPLPGDRLLRLTSGEWYSPLGRSLNRPRDREGRAIEPDSIPVFTSQAGRALLGGGGVFPDVELGRDTLTTAEQEFVSSAVEKEIPLEVRIREAALEATHGPRERGTVPESLPPEALDGLTRKLLDAGLPESALTSEALAYLAWRLEVEFFQRLEPSDPALKTEARRRAREARSQRDEGLATAVRLLSQARTQEHLFQLAALEPGAVRAQDGHRRAREDRGERRER
jgi:carboxyl-terminal processing protease